MEDTLDYAKSGKDIQYAKLDQVKRYPDKSTRPDAILWNGLRVKTADWWDVPTRGFIEIEMISGREDLQQGVDVKIEQGWIELLDGQHLPILRTWNDTRYENVVRYPYLAKTGRLCIWNVYKRPSFGTLIDERWTGNAGFWIEYPLNGKRIYHCSYGLADEPDFEALKFSVTVE